jgi:hypothetical protein
LAVDGRPSRPEFPDVTHAEKSPTAEIPQLTRRLGADGKWYKPRNKPIIGPDRRPAPPEPGALAKEPPERDMLGRPFEGPHAERMRQVFSFQPRIAQQVHLLGSLGGFMRDMAGDGHLVYGKIDLPRFHAGLRRAMSALMRICPHIICPRCRGAGCQVCRGWGWIDQWGWLSYGRRGRVGPAQENGEHEDHEDHKEHKERPRE